MLIELSSAYVQLIKQRTIVTIGMFWQWNLALCLCPKKHHLRIRGTESKIDSES